MGTGSFPEVKRGRGVRLHPHPLLVPWSRKGRAIPLLPLWAVRPVQTLSACTRVHFTSTFLLSWSSHMNTVQMLHFRYLLLQLSSFLSWRSRQLFRLPDYQSTIRYLHSTSNLTSHRSYSSVTVNVQDQPTSIVLSKYLIKQACSNTTVTPNLGILLGSAWKRYGRLQVKWKYNPFTEIP